TENLTISSAADEEHSLSKSKKLTRQEDHVSQVAADLEAGGSVALQAGQNLSVISSRITAGKEAYLVAGENLDILAAQDSDYSLYDKKKKGSFGAKNFKRDEVTDTRNISSEITTGGNLTLVSGGDQHYQVAKLNSGNDLLINSGGAIDFEGVKDLHDESHTKNKSSAAWFSKKGKGTTDETFRQSELVAKGEVAIQAVNGLRIDVKQVDQQSVSQSIDAMVKADPELAWIKDAEKRGDIDWRQVKEIHESFKYDNSGLGPAAQIVVAILMAAVMGPAGFGLSAGIGGAVATSVATTAVTSTINNKGDLGAVFKDVTSSNAIKGYAMAGVMAGFVPTINPKNLGLDLASFQTVATKVITESVIKTAIMGGSFKDNLGSSIVSTGIATGGAIAAGKIGDFTLFDDGKLTKVGMHAVLGGLMSEAMGGDFRTGALAAGANEMVVDYLAERMLPSDLGKNSQAYQAGVSKLMTASELIGALTAAATGGDASAAAAVTANSTQYNYLAHNQLKEAAEKLRKCAPAECDSIVAAYKKVSEDQTIEAIINCRFDVSLCKPSSRDVANTVADLSSVYDALGDGSKYAKDSLQILINENLEFQETLAVATTGASAQAVAETLQAKLKLTPEETVELAEAIGGGLAAAAGGVVAFRKVLARASKRLEKSGEALVDRQIDAGSKALDDNVVVRSDDDFSSQIGSNGKPKAHINENGELVPPNQDGTGSIQTHVRGGGSENSPYISVTDPRVASDPKGYGSNKIEIDVDRLQKDIDSGLLPDTRFLTNREVVAELQARVNAAREKYIINPSPKNQTSLSRAESDLGNTVRDGECLIKGCVPATYIKHIDK
ncbi:hemagglutination repeat-containing protein, partial [Pseudomonas syringae pv. japonica str. M301072]